MEKTDNSLELMEIIHLAEKMHATDIHLVPGNLMMFRIDGELIPQGTEQIEMKQVEEIIHMVTDADVLHVLEKSGEVDFGYTYENSLRMRINIYRQMGKNAITFRLFSGEVPTVTELEIPEQVQILAMEKSGLIITTGLTGSGKTTTLASLVEQIAKNSVKNIITIENPVEYLHTNTRSMVNQREVGADTESFYSGLVAAMRQDPDVIEISELDGLDTIETAIEAAMAGHLVLASIPARGTKEAVERMIEMFPQERQQLVRVQLAETLLAVVMQQLIPKSDASGRIRAYEVLIADEEIRRFIRENTTAQISAYMKNTKETGMQMMDDAIVSLYMRSMISADDAIKYARDPASMVRKVDKV